MTNRKPMITGIMLFVWILAACAPQQPGIPVTGETSTPSTPTEFPNLPPEAVLQAQEWLANQINVAIERVQIIEIEQAEWTDSCLGLGQPNESCLQVITPGWRAVFEIDGQRYEVRTDQTGATIRLATPFGTPGMEVTLENTHWSFISFGSPDGEQTLIKEAQITLMLSDGNLGGFGGCNSYGGSYQLNGNNLSIDQITSTLRACADPEATEQEQRYLRALESASRFELNGNQLVITYDDGTGFLIFEAPLPAGPGALIPTAVTPDG